MSYLHYRPLPGSGLLAAIAWVILRLVGWQAVLPRPVPMKCVVVVYPHTSNWDFPIGLLFKWTVGIRFRWVAKDTMFDSPLGPLYRLWGGIPVNRRERTGFAEAMRDAFSRHEEFRLVIAPEATRSHVDHWKSGFYHIARAANVPVALAFIDYSRREIGMVDSVDLSGDIQADMGRITTLYEGRIGKIPDRQGPIRLREAQGPDG